MSALDTAKEIGRMTATATLGKDVIDLLKEKVALLAEQVAALETENRDLKAKAYELEQQLKNIKPKGDLEGDTVTVLQLIFEHDGLTPSQIASALKMKQGIAEYHCETLRQRKMLSFAFIRTLGAEDAYYMAQPGREYLVKNGLVK